MSVAAQLVWSHLCFQKDYAVNENGGKWGFEKLDKRAEGNNVNYLAARVPLMLSLQDNTDYYIGIGIAPELRTNAWYRLKGADGNTTDTYKLNRMGLNAMLYRSDSIQRFVWRYSFVQDNRRKESLSEFFLRRC